MGCDASTSPGTSVGIKAKAEPSDAHAPSTPAEEAFAAAQSDPYCIMPPETPPEILDMHAPSDLW